MVALNSPAKQIIDQNSVFLIKNWLSCFAIVAQGQESLAQEGKR